MITFIAVDLLFATIFTHLHHRSLVAISCNAWYDMILMIAFPSQLQVALKQVEVARGKELGGHDSYE